MLFSGLINISLQILRIVGRVLNELRQSHVMSKVTITIDYYKLLLEGACIDQASSYLEGAEEPPLRGFTKQ